VIRVYQEYKQTIHYTNAAASAQPALIACAKDWVHKPYPQVAGQPGALGQAHGSIDTKKVRSQSHDPGDAEWARMKDSNSANAATAQLRSMSAELQKQTPYRKHMKAKEEGKTCIDCHKGIAHQTCPKNTKNRTSKASVDSRVGSITPDIDFEAGSSMAMTRFPLSGPNFPFMRSAHGCDCARGERPCFPLRHRHKLVDPAREQESFSTFS